jgi:hypothetical protein
MERRRKAKLDAVSAVSRSPATAPKGPKEDSATPQAASSSTGTGDGGGEGRTPPRVPVAAVVTKNGTPSRSPRRSEGSGTKSQRAQLLAKSRGRR